MPQIAAMTKPAPAATPPAEPGLLDDRVAEQVTRERQQVAADLTAARSAHAAAVTALGSAPAAAIQRLAQQRDDLAERLRQLERRATELDSQLARSAAVVQAKARQQATDQHVAEARAIMADLERLEKEIAGSLNAATAKAIELRAACLRAKEHLRRGDGMRAGGIPTPTLPIATDTFARLEGLNPDWIPGQPLRLKVLP